MKKTILTLMIALIANLSQALTLEQFAAVTAPFAETIVMIGANQPDSVEVDHFLYACSDSDEAADIIFADTSSETIPAHQGKLLYVNADGSHQVLKSFSL